MQGHDNIQIENSNQAESYIFGNTKLAEKEELEIDNKLTWTKHISNISSSAEQRLGALRRVANKLDTRGRATVYKAHVRSVMEYVLPSWMSASPTTLYLTQFRGRPCAS